MNFNTGLNSLKVRAARGFSAALLLALSALPAVAAAPPKGLAAADWNEIRAEYERHRYAAFAVDGEHRARNVAQRWTSRFDGRGLSVTPEDGGWRWGLQLQSYGWSGQANTVSRPRRIHAAVERFSYEWDDALAEWYVNDARGLEHGFTLQRAPAGEGRTLEVNVAVRGDLELEVSKDGLSAHFVDAQGAGAVSYAGLKVWDAKGNDLAARMEPTAEGLRFSVDARNAAYPITIDPIASSAYLKASNTNPGDGFGWAVAIQGSTVVVTAPGEDSMATGVNGNQSDNSVINSGAAYVFVRSGGSWVQQAYLKASNPNMSDAFGFAAALSEDTVVISAPSEDSSAVGVNGPQADNSAASSGAAYVFVRSAGVWSQQAYLKAINTGAVDGFGTSLDISGNTIIVGAPGEDGNATGVVDGVNAVQNDNSRTNSGAAYTYVRSGGFWTFQSYLKASNTGEDDGFGGSVAIDRDTALVGAALEDSNSTLINGDQSNNSASAAGAAYVFARTSTSWAQQAYLKASNAETIDSFGGSVAISGDTAVVGASGEDSSSTGVNGANDNSSSASGAAYVFVRKGGLWSQQAFLKASNTDQFDQFGTKTAIAADTVIVTAIGEDGALGGTLGNQGNNASLSAGAAYVFQRSGSTWSQRAFLKASNANPFDVFGAAAAISPVEALVGATGEDSQSITVDFGQSNNDAIDAGAAYVFNGVHATPGDELGVFINGSWFVDRDGDFLFDSTKEVFGWGSPGDTPVRGDWNGDGFLDFGVFAGGSWFIDSNGDAFFDPSTDIKGWGAPGWIPVVGDWNGDGVTNLGVVDPATMTWFRDLNGDFVFDSNTEVISWGLPGDIPMPGDWNGDGVTDLGVLSGAFWLIDLNGNDAFDAATEVREWGVPGWIPVVGDWDGDGGDEIGMIEPATSTWFRDVNGDFSFDASKEVLGWGSPGDTPVVGDWNGDGASDVGVYSGGNWFIDSNGDGVFTPATDVHGWGVAGWTPVPAAWQ